MRVLEIRHAIDMILNGTVSEVLGITSTPSHTTSRVSPVTMAAYMCNFIFGPVSGF